MKAKLHGLADDTRVGSGHDDGNRSTRTMGHENKQNPHNTGFFLDA
jgi:hypothetical protein